MVPALKDYGNEIDNLQQYIANGTVDVMGLFMDSTANAMQVLQQTGANVRKSLLGSAAVASGMPMQQFEQQYSQIQGLPPAQQNQILSQAFPDAAARFQSSQISPDTGDRSTGAVTPAAPTTPASGTTQPSTPSGPVPIVQRTRGPGDTFNFSTSFREEGTQGQTAQQTPQASDYQYSGYQDRGTPSISSNIRGFGVGSVQPTQAAPGTGFYGAMDQLNRGEARSLAALAQGTGQARTDIIEGRDAALGRLDPYSAAGREALQREAALSGALGPEAQQEAIDAYIESPGQQYLRERQEQALLRNTAAIGGLGGGRVRTALMEQAMGIASTQQQQHLENLRSLAGRGQQADTTGASIQANAGAQLAQLAEALGVRGANLVAMSAQEKAGLAERAGLSLAQLDQIIGTAQAGQLATLGGQLATTQAGGLADIAGLGQQGATTQLTGQQNISQILANLATQQGTNLANLGVMGGSALAAGQAQAGHTMGQMFQDLGQLGAYALANKAEATQPNAWASGQPVPNTYTNTGMGR